MFCKPARSRRTSHLLKDELTVHLNGSTIVEGCLVRCGSGRLIVKPSWATAAGQRPRNRRTTMDDRNQKSGNETGPLYIESGVDQDSTLLPMLIAGLVLIVIGMIVVMWLT
jgi:hypothetical protein